ncbi:hypothetical protein M011DRAFT_471634 [Sporormia fimetaria CBS 119925]|uniref:UspA domain-containing protein n=1 Tax=Sporormia fimetaria CBS 119925 TaxID=1340428 RepID=A0A6A6UY57_9PLEO|nr:hypothetical protein M011DRAFT_471634 [Sporormia fimetaria CBS 119925]
MAGSSTPNSPTNVTTPTKPNPHPGGSPLLPPTVVHAEEPRRLSIQFKSLTENRLSAGRPRQKRRLSSPPPPPVFQPRVSFDTFDRTADNIEDNSFTLIAKHKDYEYTKRSRTFLCGCDDNDYSDYALQWLIDELVDDGDEIVCLRVVEKIDTGIADRSADSARYRSEAHALMKQFQAKNHENKAINLILEFAVGKVNKVIDDMINLYEPAILVVGTKGRGLGGFQGLLPGSVSKYCLQSSPVPVIVVLPSSKRDKSRVKRAQDPSRQGYKDLLEKSGPQAGYNLAGSSRNSLVLPDDALAPASRDEAHAVAKAIGYKAPTDGSPLAQVQTPGSTQDQSESGSQPRSPGVVMKSPTLRDLDSPESTDSSSSEDEQEARDGTTAKGKGGEDIGFAVGRTGEALSKPKDSGVP